MASYAAVLFSSSLLRLAAGQAYTYETALGTEGRVQGVVPAQDVTAQLAVDPRVGIKVDSHSYSLTAAYFPDLTVDNQPGTFHVLHAASVGATWKATRNWGVDGTLVGSYGTRNLLIPLGTGTTGTTTGTTTPVIGPPSSTSTTPLTPQTLPSETTLDYASISLSVGTGLRFDGGFARLAVSTAVEGGATPAARVFLPLERDVGASGALNLQLSRLDLLGTVASETLARFTGGANGGTQGVGSLEEVYSRSYGREQQGKITLGAGPTLTTQYQAGVTTWQAGLGGQAGVSDQIVYPAVTWSVFLQVAPAIDPVTENTYNDASATVTLSWTATTGWLIGTTSAFGYVLNGSQAGDRVLSVDAHVTYTITRAWGIRGGVYYADQKPHVSALPTVDTWEGYLGIHYAGTGRF